MKLEDQVCTREQSEKLLHLGISNDSFFHWYMDDTILKGEHWACGRLCNPSNVTPPAFTVAELGVMLSNGFQVDRSTFAKTKGKFYTYGTVNDFDFYDTEAQARAAKLINALERELITVDEVNQRLIS